VTDGRPAPLDGVRVVELAGMPPTTFAAMLLADFGAEVVRVGRSPEEWRDTGLLRHRAAQSWLDLKSDEGRRALLAVVASADVLLESNRPGVCERLGIGPDECAAANPRLIYARLTGWGQDGPYAGYPGHDINYIALSGLLHPLGDASAPPRPPLNLVGNLAGGALTLGLGIVAALFERDRSGRGQVIDAAMLDGALQLSAGVHEARAQGRFRDDRGVNMTDGSAPFYRCYETADGRYVALGAVEPQFYAVLIELLGLPDELRRDQHDRALWPPRCAQFAAVLATRARDEWVADPRSMLACLTPVLAPGEVAEHPHLRARSDLRPSPVGTPEPEPAPRFSGSPTGSAPPRRAIAAVLDAWDVDTLARSAFGA
jgi:alpha-methylacyl-CoA racemase